MIVGAGLAGLIAAHAFPNEPLVEASPEPTAYHKALLRFRTTKVADLTGLEFRPVQVDKAIWFEGREVAPSIRFSNLYAEKVIGKLLPRSISHIKSVTRYIADPGLYERLLTSVGGRIEWGTSFDFSQARNVISTAPLTVPLTDLKLIGRGDSRKPNQPDFKRASIVVERFKIANSDVFQTIYFPSPSTPLYRASITGDLLICEFAAVPRDAEWQDEVSDAFGIGSHSVEQLESSSQKFGKIAPIDEGIRRAYIAKLTSEYGIFSLGRFATWRNILLDDVVDDIAVIKRLMSASEYEQRLAAVI